MTFDRTLGRRNKPVSVEPTEWQRPPQLESKGGLTEASLEDALIQVVLSDQPAPDLGDDDLVPDEPKPKAKVKRKTKAKSKQE